MPKGRSSDLIKLVDSNTGKPVLDNEVPDYINNYFATIGSKLAKDMNCPWTYTGEEYLNNIPNIVTDEDEILKLAKDIDVNKSSAIEYISSRIIKDVFITIPVIIAKLYNTSLSSGLVPLSWKSATIIPLKKEGNSPDVNNLRPISLLPIQGKLLEKIVHNRLMAHLELYNILDTNQGGFRTNHSTTDTIVKFTENLYKNINQGLVTVAAYKDLRKAFDTVNHTILLEKLSKVGIKGTTWNWVNDYLLNRTQCVIANNYRSRNHNVTCGVPQGSVLGPLLFLVYINDLNTVLNFSGHYLYADDTVLFSTGVNQVVIENRLQAELNKFESWCKCNKLTVNIKKSNIVVYGTSSRVAKVKDLTLVLNNEKLIRVLQIFRSLLRFAFKL